MTDTVADEIKKMWAARGTETLSDRLRKYHILGTPPPLNPHLGEPGYADRLWRGMQGDDVVVDDSGDDAEPVEPVKRTRKRKPSVTSVIRQMKQAGVEVAGCEINPDGTVKVISGKPNEATTPDSNDDDTTTDHSWDDIDAQAKTKPPVH